MGVSVIFIAAILLNINEKVMVYWLIAAIGSNIYYYWEHLAK